MVGLTTLCNTLHSFIVPFLDVDISAMFFCCFKSPSRQHVLHIVHCLNLSGLLSGVIMMLILCQ